MHVDPTKPHGGPRGLQGQDHQPQEVLRAAQQRHRGARQQQGGAGHHAGAARVPAQPGRWAPLCGATAVCGCRLHACRPLPWRHAWQAGVQQGSAARRRLQQAWWQRCLWSLRGKGVWWRATAPQPLRAGCVPGHSLVQQPAMPGRPGCMPTSRINPHLRCCTVVALTPVAGALPAPCPGRLQGQVPGAVREAGADRCKGGDARDV